MTRSIKENLRHFSEQERIDLRLLLEKAQEDITDLRTKLAATHAKLDADTGVNDTDYASSNDPATQQFLP